VAFRLGDATSGVQDFYRITFLKLQFFHEITGYVDGPRTRILFHYLGNNKSVSGVLTFVTVAVVMGVPAPWQMILAVTIHEMLP
jgi:hypothetical protein